MIFHFDLISCPINKSERGELFFCCTNIQVITDTETLVHPHGIMNETFNAAAV